MHGETAKFTNAQKAKPYNYKNTKLNLLKSIRWYK